MLAEIKDVLLYGKKKLKEDSDKISLELLKRRKVDLAFDKFVDKSTIDFTASMHWQNKYHDIEYWLYMKGNYYDSRC